MAKNWSDMIFKKSNYPEEIVNRQIQFPEFTSSTNNENIKKNDFTCKIMNEIFFNYSKITVEKTQMAVLKQIILPSISQMTFDQSDEMINYSSQILKMIKIRAKNFLSIHETFLSNMKFLNNEKIELQRPAYEDIEINSVENFHNFVDSQIQQYKSNGVIQIIFQEKKINTLSFIKLIDENPENINLLFDSILLSILNSDLDLFLKSFEKVFSLDLLQKEIKINNNYKINFSHNFLQSPIDINMNLLEDEIKYRNNFNSYLYKRSNIFAASPKFIIFKVLSGSNSPNNFAKTEIQKHPTTNDNNFIFIKNIENDYDLVPLGNDVFLYDLRRGKAFLYRIDFNSLHELDQSFFSRISPPFASDGYFIYSVLNNKEIGVYRIDKINNKIILERKVQVKKTSTVLDEKYNDYVISKDLVNKSLMITNGFVLQFIVAEDKINGQFVHFGRVISLVTGNHIKDYRFNVPFQIFSACVEPVSKVIWAMTVYKYQISFFRFRYEGPEPLWLSNANLPCILHLNNFCTFNQFCKSVIDFWHSVSFQFFGCENSNFSDYFLSFIKPELVDSVLMFLSKKFTNAKFNQFLFALLSIQLTKIKLSQTQADILYEIIQFYILIPFYYDILTLFLVNIANNCPSKYISRYFGLLFQSLRNENSDSEYIFTQILRLIKSKKYPYIFANNLPFIISKLIDDLFNVKISETCKSLLISCQTSIFLNYSRIQKTKPQKIEKIDTVALDYTTIFISKIRNYIKNYKHHNILDKSPLIILLRKLLIDLQFPIIYSPSSWKYLLVLIELSKEFLKSKLFNDQKNSIFYFTFWQIIDLCFECFKKMFSFPNIRKLKMHLNFIHNSSNEEKTVSVIFNDQLNDVDLNNVINFLYSKVPHVLNKRLTKEDKEFEKSVFLSLIYKAQEIESIVKMNNQIKNKEEIQILPSIKAIIQEIYKMRSFLRSQKQNISSDKYSKLVTKFKEKSHFVLKSSPKKSTLKHIIDFLNDDTQI